MFKNIKLLIVKLVLVFLIGRLYLILFEYLYLLNFMYLKIFKKYLGGYYGIINVLFC